jgi:O-antigen/teichoic acid export membrane protein
MTLDVMLEGVLGIGLYMAIGASVVAFVIFLLGRPPREVKISAAVTAAVIGVAFLVILFWPGSPPSD